MPEILICTNSSDETNNRLQCHFEQHCLSNALNNLLNDNDGFNKVNQTTQKSQTKYTVWKLPTVINEIQLHKINATVSIKIKQSLPSDRLIVEQLPQRPAD